MEIKVFTLDEANRLIPTLSSWIEDLASKKKLFSVREADMYLQDALGAEGESQLMTRVKELEALAETINGRITEIHGLGCELKDIDQGLVDFLTVRANQLSYLCWKQGEDRIRFWHDLQSGFPGRKVLEDEQPK